MQSEYRLLSLKITNEHITHFLDSQAAIRVGFANEGWIAGGFAREAFKCASTGQSFRNYLFEKSGDIDFFFQEDKKHLIAKTCRTSDAVFATNYTNDKIKVQFVTAFTHSSVGKTFESFDFYNCCYAITRRKGEYFVEYLPQAKELDAKKELGVKCSNSPYTLQRIVKYLSHKNLDKISKESDEIVYDVIVRAASESFDKKFRYNVFKPYTQDSLMQLFKIGIVKKEDLILFLGKYSVVTNGDSYGPSIVEDWAMSELESNTISANKEMVK